LLACERRQHHALGLLGHRGLQLRVGAAHVLDVVVPQARVAAVDGLAVQGRVHLQLRERRALGVLRAEDAQIKLAGLAAQAADDAGVLVLDLLDRVG
jgi:hypothetical protein